MPYDRYTALLAPDTVAAVTNQYFDLEKPYAFPRYGNECTGYVTGKDYMKAVADAIRAAKKFIFITGWQLDSDVELDQRGAAGHPGRLTELLADAMARGVHVRVMLYDSINLVLETVDTHEEATRTRFDSLATGKGSMKVMLQNPNTGRGVAKWGSNDSNTYFSHHQKTVIVDGSVAFVGGIDLAYGRWDDNTFNVVVDPAIHVLNDAYNGQVTRGRKMTAAETKLTEWAGKRPGFMRPANNRVLDERCQPRQPWQDIAVRIKGPAAFDVFANFVLRWNSFAGVGTNWMDGALTKGWFDKLGGPDTLVDPLLKGAGSNTVQICRSASSKQLKDELGIWRNGSYITDDWKKSNSKRRDILIKAREAWVGEHQTSIRDAMINCIRSAQGYIYIENQFFVSDCGADEKLTKGPANNQIVHELTEAVRRAINANRAFHIWLVLPEHPEGLLEDEATSSQAWWALQSARRGQHALIRNITMYLIFKKYKDEGKPMPVRQAWGYDALAKELGLENKWRDYVTVLNLRNFGQTNGLVMTEMVYIHSKLMIVDDAVAIIGSANINDRSLNGNGDTELAAVIVDDSGAAMTDVGQGLRIVTRKFARDLRIKVWKKHFGMSVEGTSTGVKKQGLPAGINLERPLEKASIKALRELAIGNRRIYDQVFLHTPRDSFGTLAEGRRHYKRNGKLDLTWTPPLDPDYMSGGKHNVAKATAELAKIKGFFVEMPLQWGSKELKTPPPPLGASTMIARNEEPTTPPEVSDTIGVTEQV
ncbi:phospholipase D1/2 [Lysobacter sp. yr284]|uniref:phospholipase D-like domain-containing protein n=1 Tax=Lysobacter sp. yr284 TaxID=1761791 RepID=UPI000899E203|nr:phospholipase D-like domain-containing protein [Lysobacter sp. yr284]SDY78436.1 phospholipase D1/2 [Lysobacter sp. yr284]